MIKCYIASPVQGVSMLTRAVTVLSPSTLWSADWTVFCAEREKHYVNNIAAVWSTRPRYSLLYVCLLFDIRTPWEGGSGCRTRSTGDRNTSTFLKSWFKLKALRAAAQKKAERLEKTLALSKKRYVDKQPSSCFLSKTLESNVAKHLDKEWKMTCLFYYYFSILKQHYVFYVIWRQCNNTVQ